MKKIVAAGVVLLVLVNLGGVAYKMGWLSRVPGLSRVLPASLPGIGSPSQGPPPAVPADAQPGVPAAPAAGQVAGAASPAGQAAGRVSPADSSPGSASVAPAASTPPAGSLDARGQPLVAPDPFDGNVASPDWGGTVEWWSTDSFETPDGQMPIVGQKLSWARWTQSGRYQQKPGELVVSFFAHEPILVDRAILLATVGNDGQLRSFPKDVEIWTSMASTFDGPYTKVATAALVATKNPTEATVTFPPIEARFLKFRALANQVGEQDFFLSQLKVMEAQRTGYVPLMTRHPELQWPGGPNRSVGKPAGVDAGACAPDAPVATPPSHPESRKVILLGDDRGTHLAGTLFQRTTKNEDVGVRHRPSFTLDAEALAKWEDDVPVEEKGVLSRAEFRFVAPRHARAALFAPALGYDTLVLGQVCNGSYRMDALKPLFKQALMAWVAAGHKLIIQDSDDCAPGPDYSFIPFKMKTDTPGARGAPGFDLRFVENNAMLQSRTGRPAFLDAQAWVTEPRGRRYRNELGDANVFTQWDANWCGHLAVRNVHNVLGFAVAYARYGRGLIIYDGFDNDQNGEAGYDEVVVRELAQGFDPDNLPCGARLGDFVVTTETPLLERAAVPGRTYTYPLTLISNLGYTGTVNLSARPAAGAPALNPTFEPASVALAGEGRSALSVTLPSLLPNPSFAMEVNGADASGRTGSLCLKFGPATSGELTVVSTLAPPTKTRKNLEIILDASGSMKTLMGKKTRWDVALETLQQVLAQLPDDFNVGLRVYGHREASRSPRTCTDSELVVPIRKLDRNAVLNAAKRWKPKGETPLVYSAMQAPADLKSVGGGTVILITDGEESCKGDPVKAAADLKASGLDIRLNIVGFALKAPKVQRDLSAFSQATGGLFYAADSGRALADALMVAAVDKFPYTVYDAQGKAVLSGDAGSGSDPLPPGDYKVVIKAGTKELVAPKVSLAAGQSVTLTIAMKAGQLVLQ
jgi:hypothetical protein